MSASRHRKPHLAWQLRGQLMELQCSQQTEHRLRYFGRHEDQALVFRKLGIRQTVKTASDFFQLPCGRESCQRNPRRTQCLQIAGAQHPFAASEIEDALWVGGKGCSEISSVYFG
jgi:hypothetical protein